MNNTHRIGMAVVAVVAVLCAAVLVLSVSSKDSERPAAAAEAPFSSTRPATGKTPQKSTPKKTTTPTRNLSKEEKLRTRLDAFAAAYYHIGPDDTEETHRNYIRRTIPYIKEALLRKLYFGLEESRKAANQQREDNDLTMTGKAVMSRIRFIEGGQDSDDQLVYVPVTVTLTRPDGREDDHSEIMTASKWRFVAGNWQLVGFSEFSEGSDAQ